MSSSALESKSKNTHLTKMDKRWLRVALRVLGAVKEQFLDMKQFIEDLIDECQKGKISAEEVIFFTSLEAKS